MTDRTAAERHRPLDFFEEQARARFLSRFLIIPFVLSAIVTAMIAAAIVLAIIEFYLFDSGFRMTVMRWLMASGAVSAVIILVSMAKMHELESGDLSKVVQNFGAEHLTNINSGIVSQEQEKFRNTVAEMAIASGVPMPQLYIMDNEININALTVGRDRNNAAIILTHGAIRMLDREELQALAAHEFSHILNGDIFLNMRLMGVTYGLSFITEAGLKLFSEESGAGASAAGRSMAPVLIGGVALIVVGSLGHFCSLVIKHFIVLQRKKLADAATLQFTRSTQGAASLLKKIKANKRESFLIAHTSHFEHMLFAAGKRYALFNGHEPLEDRIRYFDPYFKDGDLRDLRKTMKQKRSSVLYEKREIKSVLTEEEKAANQSQSSSMPDAQWFSPENIMSQIGTMRIENLITASMLLKGLPENIKTHIYDPDWASTIAIFLLLSDDHQERANELSQIAPDLSPGTKQQIMSIMSEPSLAVGERLSILEVLISMLKHSQDSEIANTSAVLQKLVAYRQTYQSFDYALTRVYGGLMSVDDETPQGAEKQALESCAESAITLLAIVSMAGHDTIIEAKQAFDNARQYLPEPISAHTFPNFTFERMNADAFVALDQALAELRLLDFPGKQRLIDALAHVVFDDGRLTREEQELFRVICFVLGVPVPLLQHYRQSESVRVTEDNLRENMGG